MEAFVHFVANICPFRGGLIALPTYLTSCTDTVDTSRVCIEMSRDFYTRIVYWYCHFHRRSTWCHGALH
jgi:hypothetical protein